MKIITSKNDLRETGISVSQKDFYNSFVEMGFPNKKKEDWKFTDLDKVLNSNFDQLTPFKEKNNYKPEKIFNFDHYSIINLNGAPIGYDLFRKGSIESAETLFTEVNHLKDHSIFFGAPYNLTPERHTTEIHAKKDQMLSLNLSFVDRGYSFKICHDLEKPLVIYNYYDYDLQDKMINNTNSIKFENSKCTIIEVDIDKSKCAYFKNTFKKYEVQDSEVDYLFINLKKSKAFNYINNTINITDLNAKKGSLFLH